MKQKLEDLCRKLGLRVGKVREAADKANMPTDDSSLYWAIRGAMKG